MTGPKSLRVKRLTAILGMAVIFVFLYQNCDPVHMDEGASASTFGNMKGAFGGSLYQFTKGRCNGCHIAGGLVSQKPFADPSLDIAFTGFKVVTGNGANLAIYKTKGTDGHGGAATVAANAGEIDAAIIQYNVLLNGTSATPNPEPFQYLSGQYPAPTAAPVTTLCQNVAANAAPTISVNLAQIPNGPSPAVEGTFAINITKHNLGNPASHIYCFSRPRIIGGTKVLKVKGIFVRLNGQYLSDVTTFKDADMTANPGQTVEALPQGSTVPSPAQHQLNPADFAATDKFEIGFGSLSNQ